jgi:hypothetical protein
VQAEMNAMEELQASLVWLDELKAAVRKAKVAVTAVENGSDSEKEVARDDLSHAEFKYRVARKRLDTTGGGSGELPPHNHSSCHQRPCHRLLCPFLHPPQLHLSARRRMRLYLP